LVERELVALPTRIACPAARRRWYLWCLEGVLGRHLELQRKAALLVGRLLLRLRKDKWVSSSSSLARKRSQERTGKSCVNAGGGGMTYRTLDDSLPFVQIVSNRASRRPGKGSLLHLLQFLRQSLRRGSSHCALAALFTMYGRVRRGSRCEVVVR
jgi:hypothetical protein